MLFLDSNISPHDSASQVTKPESTTIPAVIDYNFSQPRKPRGESALVWKEYTVEILDTMWTAKGKNKPMYDRLITCIRCPWTTKDSLRHGATTNMRGHLQKRHNIDCDGSSDIAPTSIATLIQHQSSKEVMHQFEENLVRWIVADNMAFSAIESSFFRKMIDDIPGITMPFKSRNTLTSRIGTCFKSDRERLIEELAISSQTIALSLDGWTSSNDISFLAIIGHWLTEDFEYKEVVLEFTEIEGHKSGENMAKIVLDLLRELDIESKLISITGDNASNNETLT